VESQDLRDGGPPAGLGRVGAVQYNQSFFQQDQIFSNEGVDILPVKPNLMAIYGPQPYTCSAQGHSPVKIERPCIRRAARTARRFAGAMLLLMLALTVGPALAQQPQTIEQIRVIGNRRIPKETVLARLFTHPGDVYDPISIERDFNSLWNTSYFEDLRIEREDSEKPSRSRTCSTASRRRRSA
jgi:outer membrane protein insertion porin family